VNTTPDDSKATTKPRSWQDEIQINRSSIRPLYLQVKEALELWISDSMRSGSLSPGDRLPSENELSDRLNISNITIKRAMDELRRQGLIQRIQGRGSFVIGQKKVMLNLQRLFSLTTFTRESGMRPARETLEISELTASASIAKHLGLPPGSRVIHLVRLRLMDKVPVAIDTSFLPKEFFPDLITVYNDQLSLYEVMASRYDHEVVKAHDILGPVLIKPDEANALEVPVGTIGVIVERTGLDAAGVPLEFTKMIFRGDLCNFSIDYSKESDDEQPLAE
jgi:GntR family transcriptional regulator, N-acetylglucosamine utilization regulator